MSVKQWVKTLVVIAIPIVNLVFLFRWAFGEYNVLKNYSRAFLIVISIFIGFSLMLGIAGAVVESQSYQGQTQATYDYVAVEEYNRKKEEDLTNNLEILDISIERDASDFAEIVGKVRNNSTSKAYSNFTITCNVYDKDNAILQTVNIFIENTIPEGEILKFSEFAIHIDAFSVKVIKIS